MKCPLVLAHTEIKGDHDEAVAYHQNDCLGHNCAWWYETNPTGKTYGRCAVIAIASNLESISVNGG